MGCDHVLQQDGARGSPQVDLPTPVEISVETDVVSLTDPPGIRCLKGVAHRAGAAESFLLTARLAVAE